MEQHPVPQAITTYKFKLVGDMTLKQFLELAGGVVTAWLLFSSPVNFLVKWTLGPFFAFLGFALAFLPVEERPLDQWIINFIKAVYGPTQFIYRVRPKIIDVFKPVRSAPAKTRLAPASPEKLTEYLKTLPPSLNSKFDQAEQGYLNYVGNLFTALGVAGKNPPGSPEAQPVIPAKTNLKGVRVRQLMHPQMCLLPRNVIFSAPVDSHQAAIPITKPASSAAALTKAAPNATPVKTAIPAGPKSPPLATEALAKAPKAAPVLTRVAPKVETAPTSFASGIFLPQLPDKPNLVIGVTLDKTGKIASNVILEIKDSHNVPVRAFKSNKLGQFFIATPLDDGVYQISADHPDYRFAIMKLEAKGEIIPPLKIQAI